MARRSCSENIRWPSGSTECFSHTTNRGRQFDTRGWATASTERGIRFLARWPFGVSPVTIKSSTHKVFFENIRWPSGSTECFSHTTTRGRQFDTRGWATASTERGIRFLARWLFGVSPVTIKSSTCTVLRTSGGLAAVLNVSHTRLLEVASSILGGSGVELVATRGFTWAPLALQTASRKHGPLSGRLKILKWHGLRPGELVDRA
ncbi:hypothetical protein YC2023_086336 [Brassica napus]